MFETEDSDSSVWILFSCKEEKIFSGSSEAWKRTIHMKATPLLRGKNKKTKPKPKPNQKKKKKKTKKKRNYINPVPPDSNKDITGGEKSSLQVFSEWKFGRISH